MTNTYAARLCGVAVAGLISAPLHAQPVLDIPPGVDLTFSVAPGFEYNSNPDLEIGDNAKEESSFFTQLGFAYETVTRAESLSLSGNLRFYINNNPEPGLEEYDLEVLPVRLRYEREAKSSSFFVAARYSDQSIAYLQPLETFYDAVDDAFILPDDIDDLYGNGRREDTGLGAGLVLGKDGPLSLDIEGRYDRTRYYDAGTGLNDYDVYGVTADLGMRLTPVTQADLIASYGKRDEHGTDAEDSESQSLSLALEHAFTKVLAITATGGYSNYTTSDDDDRTGFTGGLDLVIDRPIGIAGANVSVFPDYNDKRRLEASIRRSYEFASGTTIQGTLGSTAIVDSGFKPRMIGDLRFDKQTRNAALSLILNRSFRFDDDTDEIQTLMRGNIGYTLTRDNSVNFGASYIATEEVANDRTDERFGLSASYNHALTRDWNLVLEAGYDMRREDDFGDADNQSLALGLRRAFSY